MTTGIGGTPSRRAALFGVAGIATSLTGASTANAAGIDDDELAAKIKAATLRFEPIGQSLSETGAKGNGSDDDTAAVQAAFNSVAAGPGIPAIHVAAPTGVFRITKTVVVDSRAVKMVGQGIGNPANHTNPGKGTSFIWDGPAGQPMFKIRNSQSTVFEDIYLGGNNARPPSELVLFENDGVPGQNGTNQHITFNRVTFGRLGYYTHTYPNHVKSQRCVRMGGVNLNNDQMWFYDCSFGGATDALVSIDNKMTLWCSFMNPVFDGRDESTLEPTATGVRTAAAVAMFNPQFNRCSPDLDITSGTPHLYMWNSEQSAKLAHIAPGGGLVAYGGTVVVNETMGANMIEATGHGADASISLQDVWFRSTLDTWPKLKVRGSVSAFPGILSVRGCSIPASAYDVAAGEGTGGLYVNIDDGPVYLRRRMLSNESMPAPVALPLRVEGYAGDGATVATLLSHLDRAGIILNRSTTAKTTRTNHLLNPRFAGNGSGWTLNSSVAAATVGETLELTARSAIAPGTSLAFNASAPRASSGQQWSGAITARLTGNKTICTLRAEIKSYPSNTSRAQVDITFSPGGQTRFHLDGATIPAGDTSVRLNLTPLRDPLPSSVKIALSAPILEQAAQAGPFFHGSMAVPQWTAAWTGAANNSASTLSPA